MLAEESLKNFSSEEIKGVSNNFQDVIGEGWFGRVYKGTYEGKPLAVKVLHEVSERVSFNIDLVHTA